MSQSVHAIERRATPADPLVDSSAAPTLVGLTNSLRSDSYNRMTLQAIRQLMAPARCLEPFDIRGIPFFEPEIDPAHTPAVGQLRSLEDSLHVAEGVVVAVPEYNHSVPGRLKNALDMVSRLVSQPMHGLPVMIVSASTGRLGGARAQYEMRRILDSMGAISLVRPEVFIGDAATKFDSAGRCIDATTLEFLRQQIDAFGRLLASARVERRAKA